MSAPITERRVLTIEYAAHFDDAYLFDYLDRNEQKCVVCGFHADHEYGWVKSQEAPITSPTYWLCAECRGKKPRFVWDGWRLKKVVFG